MATGFRHIQLQQERFLQSKSQHTVWSKACTQRPAKVENLGATEGVHLWQQVLHLGSGNLNQQQREDVQPSLGEIHIHNFNAEDTSDNSSHNSFCKGCPISTNPKEEENAHWS